MNRDIEKIQKVWMTSGHGELWGCDSTYCGVDYGKVPKIGDFKNDFSWLFTNDSHQYSCTLDSLDNKIDNLKDVVEKCRLLGLSISDSFIKFLSNQNLQAQVPTCTACFLELSESPIPVPCNPGYYALRFMNDSQSCVMWYLLLKNDLPNTVVASSLFYDRDIFGAMINEDDPFDYSDIVSETVECAETFPEFIYRFWIENSIWYSINDNLPLSNLLKKYIQSVKAR